MTDESSSGVGFGMSIAWAYRVRRSCCWRKTKAAPLGRFVMTPTPGYEISYERRVVAVAIADQVGAALRPLFGSRV